MQTADNEASRLGKTALQVVKMINSLPGASDPEAKLRKYEREPAWKCPEGLKLTELDLGMFKADLMQSGPTDGIILQLHGGGYYEPMHNLYKDTAALYNKLSEGYDILTPDYRVATEAPFPAALEDALCAYRWIREHGYSPEKIIFAGDSAGGGLVLGLTLYLKDHDMPLPAGIITMSAWTDLTGSGESYTANFETDPIFGGTKDSLIYRNDYYINDSPENPYISPVFGDMTGFPPMLMQVGDQEMLLSDTLTVAEKAKKAGVKVKLHVYPGMFHIFQMGFTLYPECKAAWEEVRRFLRVMKNFGDEADTEWRVCLNDAKGK